VTSREYTLRLSAPEGAAGVEVSIDDQAWLPCRRAVGHWWYDWTGYGPGAHRVAARADLPNGLRALSKSREFAVVVAPSTGPGAR
jgi:hypothetical protein